MEVLDLNLLQFLLIFITVFIVIFGSLINWFETYLPVLIPQTFRYGKFSYNGKPSRFKVIEVPKSWFKHFYVFSSIYSSIALHLVIDVYLYGAKPSVGLLTYLDFLCGKSRKANCGSTAVIVALTLITLQSFRRFYETWFISVFSKGKINISQYIIGFLHYWATITIVLAEASGFKEVGEIFSHDEVQNDKEKGIKKKLMKFGEILPWESSEIKSRFSNKAQGTQILQNNLNPLQILGIVIFFYAWINQYICAKILANLRKNSKGSIVSTAHKIPRGGLFEYISSPHLTCEVLIYLSLLMILYDNQTFKYVFLWVLSNQLETSLLSHYWYQKTFKDYPKERKAFIPFVF